MCQFQAQARNLKLRPIMRFEDTLMVHSDRKRLKQILINLIINAIKFTYEGSVTVKAEIFKQQDLHQEASEEAEEEKAEDYLDRMETCKSNLELDDSTDNNGYTGGSFLPLQDGCSFLKIDIIDTGVGISDEDQKHLFQIFGKLKKTYHINQQGVGLGLMISKKLCEHLGGEICVSSRQNEGSTFSFSARLSGVRVRSTLPHVRFMECFNYHNIINSQERECVTTGQAGQIIPEDSQLNSLHRKLRSAHTLPYNDLLELKPNSLISPLVSRARCSCNQILIIDDNNFNILALDLSLKQLSQQTPALSSIRLDIDSVIIKSKLIHSFRPSMVCKDWNAQRKSSKRAVGDPMLQSLSILTCR